MTPYVGDVQIRPFVSFMQNWIGWKVSHDTITTNEERVDCLLEKNLVQLKMLDRNTIKDGNFQLLRHCYWDIENNFYEDAR